MNEHNIDVAQRLLYEYGSAIRGSWAEIDGRSVRSDLETIAGLLDVSRDSQNADLVDLRRNLGICEQGDGHWEEFCDDDCG